MNPRCIWLAESIWFSAIEEYRAVDALVNTDAELYETYDLCYDYDVYVPWRAAVKGAIPIKSYLEVVRLQSAIYPKNFVKMRFVENHDLDRVAHVCRDNRLKALAWTGKHSYSFMNMPSSLQPTICSFASSIQCLQQRMFPGARWPRNRANKGLVFVRKRLG